MPDQANVKQALQNLSKTIQPVLTPQGGTPLVTTETTTTATPSQATPATPK